METAWIAHHDVAASLMGWDCWDATKICESTGLPPMTFTRYPRRVHELEASADETPDVVRARLAALPRLPIPAPGTIMFGAPASEDLKRSRADAELATRAFLACSTGG